MELWILTQEAESLLAEVARRRSPDEDDKAVVFEAVL